MGQAQIAQATAQLTATANSLIAQHQQAFNAQSRQGRSGSTAYAATNPSYAADIGNGRSFSRLVQRMAELDRAPDPTVFSIGAPRAMAPAAVKAASSDWIVASGIPTEQL
eukprot:1136297-Pyramimonas_sp.AAC.1